MISIYLILSLHQTANTPLINMHNRSLFLLLLVLLLLSIPVTPLRLCGLSNAYKPTLSDSCATANNGEGGYPIVSILTGLVEIEAGALLIDNTDSSASFIPDAGLSIQWDSGSTPSGVTLSPPRYLAYVHTEASPRYSGSIADWFADALMPWMPNGVPIAAGAQLSVWINFNISSVATPGVYNGTFLLTSSGSGVAPLHFSLTVFNVLIPPLATSPFRTVYAFDNNAPNNVYNNIKHQTFDVNATLRSYFDELASLRFVSICPVL